MTTISRKNASGIIIRPATTKDAAVVCEIYTPYVLNTAITFDLDAPTVEDMREKISTLLKTYPFLVAEENGEVVGYTYASAFRPRQAYLYSIETSIYVRQDYKGNGIGRKLYTALENVLRLQHVYTANACISYVDPADEYAPATSRRFHERLGYTLTAHIPNCGRKFDKWYGIIWMQKELLPIPATPEPFVPFSLLDEACLTQALEQAVQ
jgi:phosphinothricin acetyltransferase